MKPLRVLFAAALAGCLSNPPTPVPETLEEVRPEKTIRFPGGNYGHVTVRGGLAVASSGWSREDGAGVFDVSDPANVRFVARFPAKGYSCADPVFFGNRCYVPNGFSATVIDVTDPKAPRLEGYLNPRFPKNGCSRLWTTNDVLYFKSDDGVRRVCADGFSSEPAEDVAPPKDHGRVHESDGVRVEIKDSAICTERCRVPFVFSLASVAVRGDTAYVYAPNAVSRLMPLDLGRDGLRTFGPAIDLAEVPRASRYTTMGMQTASAVTRRGDLLFADDGIVRLGPNGAETLRERTAAASSMSFDGTRVAIAQCGRCRVLDFSDLAKVVTMDVVPPAEQPLHLTGCALRGNDLFVAYTLVEEKRMDFIYRFPKKGYVAHVDLRNPERPTNTLEIAPCVDLLRVGDYLYVTGRKGVFTVVDASRPNALRVASTRGDLQDGDSYKVKAFDGRVFLGNGPRVVELDVTNPATPQARRVYRRGVETAAPSYDDFTVDGGRLYAVAHGSLDVFDVSPDAAARVVPNDCGVRGVVAVPLEEGDAAAFAGHRPNPVPPAGIAFEAGRFGNSFGAHVLDWARRDDGTYAVAYGEAGLVICDAKGRFLRELPRGTDGWARVFAAEVAVKDGVLYVKDGTGKVCRVTSL